MITDEKYYLWLKNNAKKFGFKYGVEYEDILQDFFLSTLDGSGSKFEYSFFDSIKREYNRGITGKVHAKDIYTDSTLLETVRQNSDRFSDYEFIEYMCDLRSITTEQEYQLVCLYMMGFESYEIYEKSKDISRRDLADIWKRIGIRRGIR